MPWRDTGKSRNYGAEALFSALLKAFIYLSTLFDFLDLIIINLFNFVFTGLVSKYKQKCKVHC